MRKIPRAQTTAIAFLIATLPLATGTAHAQDAETPASESTAAGRSAASGDAASGDSAGQMAFNNHCRTCHSTDAGDNRLGPSLAGVVGRKAGSVDGFAYSQSLKSSGVTFDDATLDKFIAGPASVAPGNNMKPYSGIEDAKVRADIIGFLKTK